MIHEPQEFVEVIELKSAQDTEVADGYAEFHWEDLRDRLLRHSIRGQKDGPGFMPVLFKPESEWVPLVSLKGNTHFRGDANIEAITSLVIDLDKPGAIEVAEEVFSDYERVVYSTHNYTMETPFKYRMVIRLANPILVNNWPMCFAALSSRIALDTSCCNPSRFYYYPSHSIDSTIAPRAYHKHGKALTVDEIVGLAAKGTDLSGHKISRYSANAASKRITTRRHFSGVTIGLHDSLPDKIEYTLERMEETHAVSLGQFQVDGSYHNLARDITAREIRLYGSKIDILKTVTFICQRGAELSKRYLEQGNTERELPGMILNGFVKFTPEAFSELLDKHGADLDKWVTQQVKWAIANYSDEPIPRAISKYKEDTIVEEFYPVIRARNLSAVSAYANSGNLKPLLSSVLANELKSQKPAYNEIAKALFKFHVGYHTAVKKLTESECLAKLKRDFDLVANNMTVREYDLDDQKLKFMRTALIMQMKKKYPELQAKTNHSANENSPAI